MGPVRAPFSPPPPRPGATPDSRAQRAESQLTPGRRGGRNQSTAREPAAAGTDKAGSPAVHGCRVRPQKPTGKQPVRDSGRHRHWRTSNAGDTRRSKCTDRVGTSEHCASGRAASGNLQQGDAVPKGPKLSVWGREGGGGGGFAKKPQTKTL